MQEVSVGSYFPWHLVSEYHLREPSPLNKELLILPGHKHWDPSFKENRTYRTKHVLKLLWKLSLIMTNLHIHSPDKITPMTLLERKILTIGDFVGIFPWSVYNNITSRCYIWKTICDCRCFFTEENISVGMKVFLKILKIKDASRYRRIQNMSLTEI